MSVGGGSTFGAVCLFVLSITQKRMIPVFKLGILGMTLGYTKSDMVWG